MKEQWRRQEEARLNALPVSARIIVQPQKPRLVSRIGGIDIDFLGANPFQGGVRFPNFPAPPTRRPVQSPPPCVWAVIQCCPSNQRLVTCFESLGCPGVNWDSNPCRDSVSQAARAQVEKFYRETEDEEERYWKGNREICRLVDSIFLVYFDEWGRKIQWSELKNFFSIKLLIIWNDIDKWNFQNFK